MNDVDQLLRRDGERWRSTATMPPHVDWAAVPGAPRRSSRYSWRMAAAAAAGAAALAVLALVLPSALTGKAGTTTPAHRPGPHALGGPARFMAISADGSVGAVDARTGITLGMFSRESDSRATALAVTNDGNLGFATFSKHGCKVSVLRHRQTSATTADETQAATVAGTKADAIAVSPDGHLLALAVQPCGAEKVANIEDVVVVDLRTHLQRRWTHFGFRSLPVQLLWAPDNRNLAYNVVRCCGHALENPQLLDTGTSGSTPTTQPFTYIVSRYQGQLAVLVDSSTVPGTYDIRALYPYGVLGPILGKGVPQDVASVTPDRSGSHLLLTTQSGKLLRWDDGVVTPLQGHWVDAGW